MQQCRHTDNDPIKDLGDPGGSIGHLHRPWEIHANLDEQGVEVHGTRAGATLGFSVGDQGVDSRPFALLKTAPHHTVGLTMSENRAESHRRFSCF